MGRAREAQLLNALGEATESEARSTERTVQAFQAAQALVAELQAVLPDGRRKALALTNVEQGMLWARAAIEADEAARG